MVRGRNPYIEIGWRLITKRNDYYIEGDPGARNSTHDGELLRGRVPGKDFSSFAGPRLKIQSYNGVLVSITFLPGAVLRKDKPASSVPT